MAIGGKYASTSSDETLIDLLARWVRETPDAPAFTFVDYGADRRGLKTTLSWSQIHRRAGAMAARLRQTARPGDRAALLLPQSLEYVISMLGAMYAGVIAVPLFSPDLPGQAGRLIRTYLDADPSVVVSTTATRAQTMAFLSDHHVPAPRDVITADTVEPAEWDIEPINPDDVAYLQYTSGSTRDPAGVQITHRNLVTNTSQLWTRLAVGQRRSIAVVSWLPLFHDMGLISTVAAPLLQGIHAEFTDPMAFVRQPSRWLALISGHGGQEPNGVADHETVDAKNGSEIHTGIATEVGTEIFVTAPNFAYEYCLARIHDRSAFDLRRLRWCLNGAEPVRQSTLERFAETFAEVGLRPGAQSPCYGLAEATVFVSAASDEVPPTITTVDQQSLTAGVVVPCAPGSGRTTTLVSCGKTAGQYVAIVDPETCRELSDGRIGEIWVHGPNVSPGYWRKPERTREIFGGRLVDPAPGLPEGPWLRTGDLGAVHEGELYVTGRIKDLIIVNGRNHFPQDIETTVQEAHPAVRTDHVAAFTIPGDRDERVVVVAERSREASSPGLDASDVRRIVVSAVSTHHELPVHDFVLVRTGGVPRTSSGKVSRTACKQRYLAGLLPQISA